MSRALDGGELPLFSRRRRVWPARKPLLGLVTCLALIFPLSLVAADRKAAAVPAPELRGNTWLNVPRDEKISLSARKGKVTVVHFWTYGCINCKRNLPFYNEWQKRFARREVEIIGIHTPETEAERDPANVAKRVKEYGITYPVLIDTYSDNWKTWQQRCWPAIYLVDKHGLVRFAWEGELEYQGAGGNAKMTQLIEALLRER